MTMTLDHFEALARARRATRHFRPDPLPEGLLERLLDVARWAPSGYNLQPTHFVIATDRALRQKLVPACLDQPQVGEAPAVVVFVGDRHVHHHHFELMLDLERAAGTINERYEAKLRSIIPLAFGHGPAKLGWLWKATLAPLARSFKPIPSIPAVETKYWLAKQVMLSAMVFMLAAESAGLATVPMEGFDHTKVRRILGIPRRCEVVLVVPVGYATDAKLTKTRLPLDRLMHRNGW